MAPANAHQSNDVPGDRVFYAVPHQPQNHAQQNAWVPPTPANGQPEGHREDISPPVRGIAGPQDPHHFDVAYQGVVDYHPQPLNPACIFPDVGVGQGVPAQAQPNAPVNLERNPLGYVPQHNAPDPAQAAFPHPFVHRIPTPNQGGPEHLRRLASRYLHHPDAQVGMVSMEVGATGRIQVMIILESYDLF